MRILALMLLFLTFGVMAALPIKEFSFAEINILDATLFLFIIAGTLFGARRLRRQAIQIHRPSI